MQPTAVINVVGLNQSLLAHAPNMRRCAQRGRVRRLKPVLPAVTCSVQASMLTGVMPNDHGIVGNGWYFRDSDEVRFWLRSNRLMHGEKVWDAARQRDPAFTCLNVFWRFAAYSSCDYVVIERPIYKADGRKLPDIYSNVPELREELQRTLGTFPLFRFWGPASDVVSSRWIADATVHAHRRHRPTLTLTYLPHLDYCLQQLGPGHAGVPRRVGEIDAVVGGLIDYFDGAGVRVVIVSEYGIEPVDDAAHVNRALREAGLLCVREEDGGEMLDAGASAAFAVADHQVAHVYVRRGDDVPRVAELCRSLPGAGVEQVLDREGQRAVGLDHERSGELVLVAAPGRWFSYDYWLDDAKAPDFARTVAIHDKPGYDPLDLFVDPALRCPKLRIAAKLLKKRLGFRTLMDVIPVDAKLVRGSHGRPPEGPDTMPVMITQGDGGDLPDELPCTAVKNVILSHVFGGGG
jgi:predicted AlkP superfamily pyrophosphatase or phosphodiesterase